MTFLGKNTLSNFQFVCFPPPPSFFGSHKTMPPFHRDDLNLFQEEDSHIWWARGHLEEADENNVENESEGEDEEDNMDHEDDEDDVKQICFRSLYRVLLLIKHGFIRLLRNKFFWATYFLLLILFLCTNVWISSISYISRKEELMKKKNLVDIIEAEYPSSLPFCFF